jgi:hypothetical protein
MVKKATPFRTEKVYEDGVLVVHIFYPDTEARIRQLESMTGSK